MFCRNISLAPAKYLQVLATIKLHISHWGLPVHNYLKAQVVEMVINMEYK